MTRLGLGADDLGKRPAALSGGMAQRVAFARALAVAPDLLLMDEPFGALDVGLRRSMQDLARQEAEKAGTAVLFVTHDIPEALRLASRIIVLSPRPGRIVADIAHAPLRDPAEIFRAAADLLKRPEIRSRLVQLASQPYRDGSDPAGACLDRIGAVFFSVPRSARAATSRRRR